MTKTKSITIRIAPEVFDELNEWREAQTVKPSQTATIETALRMLFDGHPAYWGSREARDAALKK